MPNPNRREALSLAALGGLAPPARRDSRIKDENDKPGTTDWQLTYIKFDAKAKYRQSLIEGYCTRTSVAVGEQIGFCVSTDPASPFTIDVFRLGYYGGTGARLMKSFGPFDGKPQSTPPVGDKRLRECTWTPCTTFAVPRDWLSGVYLAKLSAAKHRYQSFCIFVVRDDRPADIVFQCSTNTWQAYNKWPESHSLYDNDRPDKKPLVSGVRASFDRPYSRYPQVTDNPLSLGSGEFLLFEYPFAYWLEQHGYDVTYCTDEDVHKTVETVTRCKAFLSVGHDEYWSRNQYDHCMEAVKRGVNFGFFSGNSCCFVVPMLESGTKIPCRIIERVGRYGGIRPGEEKWMADLPEAAPNESTLIGAQTVTPFNGSGDWICTKPDQWIFTGTGMKKGDRIPGLVGWEFHGDPAKIEGLEVVAAGTTTNGGDKDSHYEATIYPGRRAIRCSTLRQYSGRRV